MQNKGFQGVTTQQIYQHHKIYAEDARSISQALNLGNEPFKPSEVEKIVRFAQQAKDGNLTLKQAIAQWQQIQSQQSSERTNERLMDPSEASQNSSFAVHLQSLVISPQIARSRNLKHWIARFTSRLNFLRLKRLSSGFWTQTSTLSN